MRRQLGTYHPVYGYQFIPGLKARVEHEGGGFLVRCNQAGFRSDREFIRERQGRPRVLLFGDSFTAGVGVSNRDRYGDVLETLVPEVEVFNFAIPGGAPDTQSLVYESVAAELEHDLVVIAVWVQNVNRIVARYRSRMMDDGELVWMPKPYFELADDDSLTLRNSPVPPDPVRPKDLSSDERKQLGLLVGHNAGHGMNPVVKGAIQKLVPYDSVPAYRDPGNPDWRLLKAILRRWTDELRAPAIIMPIPLHHHLEGKSSPKHYRRRFQELADPPRVAIHDPLDDLMRFSRSERRAFRFADDTHPTASYHRALAESLAEPVGRLIRDRQAA